MDKLVYVLALCLSIHSCYGLETNSKLHTVRLLYMERELLDLGRDILKKDEHYNEKIAADEDLDDVHDFRKVEKFLKEVRVINEKCLERIEEVSGDALQIFQLKSRLTNDWAPIIELIEASELFKKIPVLEKKFVSIKQVLGREASLRDAVRDILRLNDIYQTPVSALVGGDAARQDSVNPLRAMDAFQLIKSMDDMGRGKLALDTVSEALSKLNTSANEKSILLNVKGSLLLKNNMLNEAEELFLELSKSNPTSRTIQSSLKLTRDKKKNPAVPETREESEYNLTSWQQLCRDQLDMLDRRESELKCFTREYPDLKNPVHVEEIHRNPRIFILRNVLSNPELDTLRQESENQALSQMIKDETYVYGDASLYALKHAYFVQSFQSALINLTYEGSRVNLIDSVPGFLIKNHGPGGKEKALIKQRYTRYNAWDGLAIGNFYTFLNDVEEGGGIVFPSLKLKIKPEKGALVYWQFRRQKGPLHNKLQEYVECPVIKGNSWTSLSLVEHYGLVSNPLFNPKQVRTFEDMPGDINFSIHDEYTGVPIPEPEPEPEPEMKSEGDAVENTENSKTEQLNDVKDEEKQETESDKDNEGGDWSLF